MISAALQAQLGLRASVVRSIGTRDRTLQQRRVVRFASQRFLAVATAEAPAENAAPAEEAAPAAKQGGGGRGGRGGRGGGRGRGQRPLIGPERTMQLSDLEVGKTYNGAIVSVTDFGAFVNVGCATDGLLHISQISTEFVRSVAEAVNVGQDISVRILSVDADRKKFSVTAIPEGQEAPARQSRNESYDDSNDSGSSARSQERPRQARAQKGGDRRSRGGNREPCPVNAGDVVTGPVASVAPFGIFIDLGNGYSGMLHSSQMKLPEGVEDHMRHYNEGDDVEVRVLSVARGGEKVALTQKTDEEIAAEERTRTKGLSAVVDVPEGSGALAYMMAKAGISADNYKSAPAAAAPAAEKKAEKKAAPAPAAEAKTAAPAAEAKAAAAPAAGGISASLVKELREASGAGMMDCKKALAECNGDLEAAKEFLRKKGLASADRKAGRVAAEGAVWSYIHAGSRLGVLVEINCETDFVARGEKFQELVNDMAMQIAACPQVTVVNAADVPQELLDRERAIEMEKEDLKSKPEAIREKIVQGRVDKIAKEQALMEQAYVKDTNKTVAEVVKEAVAAIGENIQIRRFTRFNLGEGIEVADKGDFAAEVEAQTSAMAAKAAEKKEKEAPKEEAPAAAEKKETVAVSAAVVKQLREASGAGMMDCKKALAECGGDLEAAKDFLRKKGLASADKKGSRVAADGAIGAYIHAGSRLGVVVEVNCETDFVARGEKFRELVNDMAMQIAACPDVRYVSASDVPADLLEREKAIEMGKEDLQSKPEAIREKIVQGRVDKIAKEMALLEQAFIKDTSKTVAEHIKEQIAAIGENMQVRRFERYVLGEGIEKKTMDFAAEVAAQTGGI